MSNGEHEIRTPKGLRIGNRSVVDGKNMLQIKRGGCEDYISAESLVECMQGEVMCAFPTTHYRRTGARLLTAQSICWKRSLRMKLFMRCWLF